MKLVGFDTETYLIGNGRLAPRFVCLTLAGLTEQGMPSWLPALQNYAEGRDQCVIIETPGMWSALLTGDMARVATTCAINDRDVTLVGWNTPYDVGVLLEDADVHADYDRNRFDILTARTVFEALDDGRVRDAMTREQLLAIAEDRFAFDPTIPPNGSRPKWNLAETVLRRFGVDISSTKHAAPGEPEPWRLRYAKLDGVPVHAWPPAAKAYALEDAVWALRIAIDQGKVPIMGAAGAPLVDDQGNVTNEFEQIRAAVALHLMSCWGIRTDAAAVDEFTRDTAVKVAQGEDIATRAGFLRPPDNKGHRSVDTKKLKALVTEAYRGNPPLTPTGQVQCSRDVLKQSVPTSANGTPGERRAAALLDGYADLGIYRKYQSTYVPQLAAGLHKPINHGYRALGARSGRTSAVPAYTQNPPRGGGFRKCFVPRPGWVYCSVDFDMAELKAMAQVQLWWFESSAMGDALRAGKDLHLFLASKFPNTLMSYDEIVAVSKDPTHPLFLEVTGPQGTRQLAKIANFGFMGGLMPEAFIEYARGYGAVVSMELAVQIRELWLDTWPEMRRYFMTIAAMADDGDFTQLHPMSNRQRGGCRFTVGCNGLFQGLVADWAKASAYEVVKACYGAGSKGEASPLYGCRPVLFVHDEVIAELPAATAHEAAEEMARLMCAAAQPYCPDLEVTASPTLMHAWDKKAKEVRDASGRLLPWTPPVKQPAQPVPEPEVETPQTEDAEQVGEEVA